MLTDARELPDGTELTADLCIIGAGAAGITIAREVAYPTRRVLLLESGFVEPDAVTQSLYDGESRALPYFSLGDTRTRTRQLGGSTNQWNGECRPLGANDFETRAWMPGSGWPFDVAHLRPYYERAAVVCELGPVDATAVGGPLDGGIEPTLIRYSPPTRFGPVGLAAFADDSRTTVVLGANAVDLVPAHSGRALTHVVGATVTGRRFTARADRFVLATGGIENARLLLASDAVVRGGIGNTHDLVGRYFMEHLYVDQAATIAVHRRVGSRYATDRQLGAARVRFALTLSNAAQRDEQLPGSTFVLGDAQAQNGWAGRARTTLRRAVNALRSEVVLPMKHIQEQVPNPDSRVVLSHDRDSLGSRRADLEWRVSPIDKVSATRAHAILDRALRTAGVGRVVDSRLDDGPDWPVDLRGARHHMGTTRMHADPKRGVVDGDGRVHGVANLYVAGSSVFTTSGTANPTLTIVALALRLADHLKAPAP